MPDLKILLQVRQTWEKVWEEVCKEVICAEDLEDLVKDVMRGILGTLCGETDDVSGVLLVGGNDLVRAMPADVRWRKRFGFGVLESWLIRLFWLAARSKYAVILGWLESFGGELFFLVRYLMCRRSVLLGFPANILNKSSMVRWVRARDE